MHHLQSPPTRPLPAHPDPSASLPDNHKGVNPIKILPPGVPGKIMPPGDPGNHMGWESDSYPWLIPPAGPRCNDPGDDSALTPLSWPRACSGFGRYPDDPFRFFHASGHFDTCNAITIGIHAPGKAGSSRTNDCPPAYCCMG